VAVVRVEQAAQQAVAADERPDLGDLVRLDEFRRASTPVTSAMPR
jgi:hypothetical protein